MGVALGYERNYLNTQFNDGWIQSTGLTVSPYIGYAILKNLTIDVMGGATLTANDSTRANNSIEFRSDYQSVRTMLSTNLNYYYQLDNWLFGVKTGFMYTNDYAESFVERGLLGFRNSVSEKNAYFGEFVAGGRVSYLFEKAEPYVALNYLYDPWMTRGAQLDRDEVEGVLGVNLVPLPSLLVGIELARGFTRENIDSMRCAINLRYEF